MSSDIGRMPPRLVLASRTASLLFFNTMRVWNRVFTFRLMGQLGLPPAKTQVEWQHRQIVGELATAEESASLFNVDRKVLIQNGFFGKAAEQMTEEAVQTFESSLDAASLIFAHSILDNSVLQWIKVCHMAEPNDFMHFVDRQRFTLADAAGSDFSTLLDASIRLFIRQLERESLLKK